MCIRDSPLSPSPLSSLLALSLSISLSPSLAVSRRDVGARSVFVFSPPRVSPSSSAKKKKRSRRDNFFRRATTSVSLSQPRPRLEPSLDGDLLRLRELLLRELRDVDSERAVIERRLQLGEVRVLGHAQRALLKVAVAPALAAVPPLVRRLLFFRARLAALRADADDVLVHVQRDILLFHAGDVSLELVRLVGLLSRTNEKSVERRWIFFYNIS